MFGATRRTDVETSAGRKCAPPASRPRAVFRAAGDSFRRAIGEAMRALMLIVPAGHLVLVVATATYSRDRTGSGAFESWTGAMRWRTGPIRSSSKAPGFRPARSISPTSHLRQIPPTPPPWAGPRQPAGAAASSSPSTGASEEQEWRPTPPQPVKLASILPGARQQHFQPAPLLPPPRGLQLCRCPLVRWFDDARSQVQIRYRG